MNVYLAAIGVILRNAEEARRYRAQREKGCGAKTAYEIVKYEGREPKYPFLAGLSAYQGTVQGEVGPFTVTVKVEPDEDARLGEDDVTGWFTDVFEDGCVKNTLRSWGTDYEWYRPSNDTLANAYDNHRAAGLSRSVARDAVREQIRQEMSDDANREYRGVIVTVGVAGRELAQASLWGIDSIPGYDVKPYLIETAEQLIEEAIDQAREAASEELAKVEEVAARLRAVAGERRIPLHTIWLSEAEEHAGRRLTPEEIERVSNALGYSSIPDAVAEVVFAVCGSDEDEDEEGGE